MLPGNRLEALCGDREGQHSTRLNDQWRICFRWREDGVPDVEIVDYHRGDVMRRKRLDTIAPGEVLREEFLRPLGITISALARDIGVPANRISQIGNGKRAFSADTALLRGKYFGVSPEIWLDLQSEYELRLARRTTWKRVEPRVRTRVA